MGLPITAPSVPTGYLNHVDILWVSPTEFVSPKLCEFICEEIYQLTVELKSGGEPLELFCYSIFQFDERGEVMIGPSPAMPPRFLSHVLAPILDQVASIKLSSDELAAPPVDSALSLIPTMDHGLTQDVTICFSQPPSGLLPALVSFLFHPNVCLSLEMVPSEAAAIAQMHDYLRDLKHLRHLQIPSCLLAFECTGAVFSANPSFESLTLTAENEDHPMRFEKMSSAMLDGIMHNKNLKCLNIVFPHYGMDPKKAMEQLAEVLATIPKGHSVSRLSADCRRCRRGIVYPVVLESVESNRLWDSLFSPALVVNWLKQQQQKATPPTGQLNHRLSGMAIRAINRGIAYHSATNVVPCDLEPSSASAIFHLIVTQHDESKNAGVPGAMPASGANRLRAKRQKHGHIM
jgi:hypothetical protein